MNGALSRILERSRGTPPAIRPRIPSFWEAAPAPREGLEEPRSSDEPHEPRRATTSRENETHGEGTRRVPASEPVAPQAQRGSPVQSTVRPAVERRIETTVERRIEPQRPVSHEASAPLPPPIIEPPVRHETRIEHTVERIERPVPVATTTPAPAPAIPERHTVVKEPAPRPGPVRVQPVEVRAAEERSVPAVPTAPVKRAAQPAEPPVIRVTIGRVDVRAVPEAPARRAPEKREASRRMELDEYLQRRRGGR